MGEKTRRSLDSTEREQVQKAIKRMKEENEEYEFDMETHKRQLDKGLDLQLRKAKKMAESEFKNTESHYKLNLETIKVYEDQLKNGVEVQDEVQT